MKNREFYRDKIMNEKYGISGENNFCYKFVKPYVLKTTDCDALQCTQCRMIQSMWLDEEYEEPEVDWSKVAVNTPILVRGLCGSNTYSAWKKRYFAKYEDGQIYAFDDGSTSWSNDSGILSYWSEAKLAEVDK